MAEAIAHRDASDVITAQSAGLAPLGYVPEMTKRTLESNGYSAVGLVSKPILRDMWDAAELVVNMSGEPRERAFKEFEKVEDWEVEDPFGEDPAVYHRICEEIRERVTDLAARLREESKRTHSKRTTV
jgi:protein-tyrosine-phosphatase